MNSVLRRLAEEKDQLVPPEGDDAESLSIWGSHPLWLTEMWLERFGPDIMRGNGDVPGSTAYHADLTAAYGIRYVWRGRTTSITGQDASITWAQIDSNREIISGEDCASGCSGILCALPPVG